jgi:hypothetical protein
MPSSHCARCAPTVFWYGSKAHPFRKLGYGKKEQRGAFYGLCSARHKYRWTDIEELGQFSGQGRAADDVALSKVA